MYIYIYVYIYMYIYIHIYIYVYIYIYIHTPNYMRSTHDGGVKMAAVLPAILPVISSHSLGWHRLQRQDDGPEQAVSPRGPVSGRGLESPLKQCEP